MRITFLSLFIFSLILVTGCSDDDSIDQVAKITVNGNILFDNGDDFNGDIDASFIGNGGNTTKIFSWKNNLSRADYNADITATAGGIFQMVVKDANEITVLDKSLQGAVEPDSFSGVTSTGTSGIWTVTITLTNFNGDGSFSLSEGD